MGKTKLRRYALTAVLTPEAEGGYSARVRELPAAISQGETLEEAQANIREAAELVIEACLEAGETPEWADDKESPEQGEVLYPFVIHA
jgi:predicted RNase H-like HicB family nuclease